MITNNDGSYSLYHLPGEDVGEMLLEEDYDPSTDACDLLWPVMSGIFAEELAELAMRKSGVDLED